MEYSEEQKKKFIEEFRKKRQRRIATSIILLILLVTVPALAYPSFVLFGLPKYVWGTVFTGIIMCGLFFIIIDWRCPACNGILGDVFNTKFCSKCGFKFAK